MNKIIKIKTTITIFKTIKYFAIFSAGIMFAMLMELGILSELLLGSSCCVVLIILTNMLIKEQKQTMYAWEAYYNENN